MLEAILSSFEANPPKMWHEVAGSTIPFEAVLAASRKVSTLNRIGWYAFLTFNGQKKMARELSECIIEKFPNAKALSLLVVIKYFLSDPLCPKCKGTGNIFSDTGHRFIDCKACCGTGRINPSLSDLVVSMEANKGEVYEIVGHCLSAKTACESALIETLRKEKLLDF